MRSLRNLVFGFSLGIVATATLAWALEVKIPPRITAKANLVVDETGNALFGATPGKVMVMNLPTSTSGTPVAFPLATPNQSNTFSASFVVPAGQTFFMTDVVGSFAGAFSLSDSGGARFYWDAGSPFGTQVHLNTGVLFAAGETVTVRSVNPVNPIGGEFFTFIGRLIPAS
jgi:hypothetical protein